MQSFCSSVYNSLVTKIVKSQNHKNAKFKRYKVNIKTETPERVISKYGIR